MHADGNDPAGSVDASGNNAGRAALLLLADGRFPSGGHAHSGGLEAATALEGVCDIAGLRAFLSGRLATSATVASAFAAAACAAAGEDVPQRLTQLDEEFSARTPSPALRRASLRLGRQMLRAGRAVWPHPVLESLAAAPGAGLHQPIALGAVSAAAGLDPDDAALAIAYDAVASPATAAVRLLGLDPFAVHALIARLGARIDSVAATGAAHARSDAADMPAHAAPLLDIVTEDHATWEVRLFAS